MHVWQWLITGLIAGVIARFTLKGVRLSLGATLALGSLGGLGIGALSRYTGLIDAHAGVLHIVSALIGAVGMIATMYFVLRSAQHARYLMTSSTKRIDIEATLQGLGERERRVLGKFLQHQPVSRNANVEDREQATFGQLAADKIASFGGSWAFMGLFAAMLLAWMLFNSETSKPFDPYPFILLNLVLSCIAAAQAPVILMSQNRQAEKDRIHARLDYEVNLKAEVEILALHEKLDELRERSWRELLEMQQKQLELLERLEDRLQK